MNGLTDDMVSLLKKRTYDIAGTTTKNIKIYYNEELIKMKKTFSIKKAYIKNIENNDLLLMYLKEKRGHLQAKARKPFVGGERKVKFILPTANPKVEPVKL